MILFEFDAYNWLSLAGVFIIIELLSLSFLFLSLFFAALMMAVLLWLFPSMPLISQVMSFAVLSVLTTLAWYYKLRKGQESRGDEQLSHRASRYIGQVFIVSETIDGQGGKIKIEDSHWQVRTLTPPKPSIAVGESVRVIDYQGTILIVERYGLE